VLGVCRGMQVLNVALGGQLVQHLPDEVGDVNHQPARATFGEQSVRIRPAESARRGSWGTSHRSAATNHQAVSRLGNRAGCRRPGAPTRPSRPSNCPTGAFVVGVCSGNPETDPDDPRLFEALVTARSRHSPP